MLADNCDACVVEGDDVDDDDVLFGDFAGATDFSFLDCTILWMNMTSLLHTSQHEMHDFASLHLLSDVLQMTLHDR